MSERVIIIRHRKERYERFVNGKLQFKILIKVLLEQMLAFSCRTEVVLLRSLQFEIRQYLKRSIGLGFGCVESHFIIKIN